MEGIAYSNQNCWNIRYRISSVAMVLSFVPFWYSTWYSHFDENSLWSWKHYLHLLSWWIVTRETKALFWSDSNCKLRINKNIVVQPWYWEHPKLAGLHYFEMQMYKIKQVLSFQPHTVSNRFIPSETKLAPQMLLALLNHETKGYCQFLKRCLISRVSLGTPLLV